MNQSLGRPALCRSAAALVVILGLLSAIAGANRQPPRSDLAGSGDVMRGWRVFNAKQCMDCHAIWGQGGSVGPDLGRLRSGRLSGDRLAGIMWNHIPKMLVRMKQAGRPPESMSVQEMSDIFALINFVRQLDEPGDPALGAQIMQKKGCTACHSIDTAGGDVGPDLAKWGTYANPVTWAQKMWEHAPMMEAAMERAGTPWPKLEGADLVHVVAYVRSAGVSGRKTYLRPGSVESGRRLFAEKKCDSCHPGDGPDLATVDLPTSVGSLASRMWNHSPAMTRIMREKEVERHPIEPQELADILTYVLMLRRLDGGGDPARGRRVFQEKGCAQCHESEELGQGSAPSLQTLGGSASPANMAAAMWNHGETMLERITEAGLTWPVFDRNEMVDMLAYLEAGGDD